jgi:hypothetical protein
MRHQRTAAFAAAMPAALASAGPCVIITEIMYNPASIEGRGESEWVEIANLGDEAIDIKGWRLDDEDRDDWGPFDCRLEPLGVAVLINGAAATEQDFRGAWEAPIGEGTGSDTRASSPFQVIPVTWGSLGNQAAGENETLQLVNRDGAVICEVNYDHQAPWPDLGNDPGSSISLMDADCGKFSEGGCWTASREADGAWKNRVVGVFSGEDMGSPGVLTVRSQRLEEPRSEPPPQPGPGGAPPPSEGSERDRVPF